VPLALTGLALGAHVRTLVFRSRQLPRAYSTWGLRLAIAAFLIGSALSLIVLFTTGFSTTLGGVLLQVRQVSRPLVVALLGLGFWAWRSPRLRSFLRGDRRSGSTRLR
jgi:hypothetical protein